ncbi:MAG: AtpZ/AtpI family protein [Limnochordia bacterium]
MGDTILGKQPRKDHQLKTSDTLRALAYFSQIGITMAASVLIGVLLGRYLDILLGTAPWLGLVFSLLGAGAAIKLMFSFSNSDR